MKLGFVQWPEGLLAHSPAWQTIHEQVTAANLDILLTNELPFGPWIARLPVFDRATAQESVAAHEAGLEALKALPTKLVISSRPVWCGDRLANEAFSLEKGGEYRCLHQKHFFPAEPGWHETTWFHCGKPGFEVALLGGIIKVGVLLCTEVMFNERARQYGRAGAELIVVPRATGQDVSSWKVAGAMAAVVSGTYVVSSNRVGPCKSADGPYFGGTGFVYAPGGKLIEETSGDGPGLVVVEINPETARKQQKEYPCYVNEGIHQT